jgi:hypothetical protein
VRLGSRYDWSGKKKEAWVEEGLDFPALVRVSAPGTDNKGAVFTVFQTNTGEFHASVVTSHFRMRQNVASMEIF